MEQIIRAAIIGCGPSTAGKGGVHSVSYAHGWSIRKTTRIRLVAAASRNEANVNDFVTEFPTAKPYQDYSQMLREERPEWVSVCAFPRDREEMVLAAIEAGARYILAEKPLSVSMGAARRMTDAADRAGARLFVNHQRRYGRPFELLRDAVQQKRIGTLVQLDIVQPGNCMMNFGPHLLDLAYFVLGEQRPARVLAAVEWGKPQTHQHLHVESHVSAIAHLLGGGRLTFEAGRTGSGGVPAIRANGTDGFAEVGLGAPPGSGGVYRARHAGAAEVECPSLAEHFHHGVDDGQLYYDRVVADILAAIDSGSPTRIDAAEAMHGLELMLGIYESARTGQLQPLPLAQSECPLDLPWTTRTVPPQA